MRLKLLIIICLVVFLGSAGVSYTIFHRKNPLKTAEIVQVSSNPTQVVIPEGKVRSDIEVEESENKGGGERPSESPHQSEGVNPPESIVDESPNPPVVSSTGENANSTLAEPVLPVKKVESSIQMTALKPQPEPQEVEKRKFVRKAVDKVEFNLKMEVGTYSSLQNLQRDQERIKNLGFETFTREEVKEQKRYYLFLKDDVPMGEAKAINLKLKVRYGIENKIVPGAQGNFQIRVGPLDQITTLQQVRRQMEEAGYQVKIEVDRKVQKNYILGVGPFYTSRELSEAEDILRENGFSFKTE